jgi:hypothetical protein
MANEDLVRAERVAVGASRGWVGDPSSGSGLHEVAEHPIKPRPHGNGLPPESWRLPLCGPRLDGRDLFVLDGWQQAGRTVSAP